MLVLKFRLDVELHLAVIPKLLGGTKGYLAPELTVSRDKRVVTPMADVWSFGTMVRNVFGELGPAAVSGLLPSFDCPAFVDKCTATELEDRPTFEELVVELEVVVEELGETSS